MFSGPNAHGLDRHPITIECRTVRCGKDNIIAHGVQMIKGAKILIYARQFANRIVPNILHNTLLNLKVKSIIRFIIIIITIILTIKALIMDKII